MPNNLANKIKFLRLQHGLTLEQVAQVVGVGKSTVRKWETGMIANMRRDKIAALAQALHTTPAYLMGWGEEPQEPSAINADLNEKEYNLIKVFRSLSSEQQNSIIDFLERFNELSEEGQRWIIDAAKW